MITGTILCDAFAQVESEGSMVVKVWMNNRTYTQVWSNFDNLRLYRPTRFERILEGGDPNSKGDIWGAGIGVSEDIPNDSLLVLSDQDPPFEEGQIFEESRLFRY
jgi:hypothetical protein